jgi:hypothetical protein
MKKVTLLLIALIATLQSNATHIIGGQITSRCLGGFTQEVTLTLYRDIQGLPMPNTQTISYTSNNFTWNIFNNVSHTAPYQINSTTEAYDFIDTVTVPYLDFYTVSYSTCCRPATIINIPNPSTTLLYLDLVFLVDTTCNSTPLFPVTPYGYASVNTPYTLNLSATDIDNDSLTYELVVPLTDLNTPVIGYTFAPAMISSNGILTLMSTTIGTYDLCVKITEYRNAVEIGHIYREFQITVGLFSSINELENNNGLDYKNFYDVLGRKVNQNYDGVKIYKK